MRMHWTKQGAATGKVFRLHPLKLVGLIFSLIGLLFAVIGGAFICASHDVLPQVFTAEVWLGDPPDELALPIIGVVFAAMGLFFLLIGGIMLLIPRRQQRLREELEQYGARVTGAVTDITVDRTYTVNGRHPLHIIVTATHPYTGETKALRSGPIWETSLSTGDVLDVLFDPQDEKKYIILMPEDPPAD